MIDIPIYTEFKKPNYPEMLEQNIQDTKILAKALLDVMDMLYRMGSGEFMLKEYADSLIKIIKEENSNDN
jgi:hypothetical protein